METLGHIRRRSIARLSGASVFYKVPRNSSAIQSVFGYLQWSHLWDRLIFSVRGGSISFRYYAVPDVDHNQNFIIICNINTESLCSFHRLQMVYSLSGTVTEKAQFRCLWTSYGKLWRHKIKDNIEGSVPCCSFVSF